MSPDADRAWRKRVADAALIVDTVNAVILSNELPVPPARFEEAVQRVAALLPTEPPAAITHRDWLKQILRAGEAAFKKNEPRTSRNRFAFLYAWVLSAAENGEGVE